MTNIKSFKIKNLTFESFESLDLKNQKEIVFWRNNSKVRSMMLNKAEISLEIHLEFIKKLNKKDDKLYWRVNFKNNKIGVLYLFDITKSRASWGYYLDPELIGSGYGILLEYTVLLIAFEKLKLSELFCETLNINKSVLKIHNYFGYLQILKNSSFTVQSITFENFKKNKNTNQSLIKNFLN